MFLSSFLVHFELFFGTFRLLEPTPGMEPGRPHQAVGLTPTWLQNTFVAAGNSGTMLREFNWEGGNREIKTAKEWGHRKAVTPQNFIPFLGKEMELIRWFLTSSLTSSARVVSCSTIKTLPPRNLSSSSRAHFARIKRSILVACCTRHGEHGLGIGQLFEEGWHRFCKEDV